MEYDSDTGMMLIFAWFLMIAFIIFLVILPWAIPHLVNGMEWVMQEVL